MSITIERTSDLMHQLLRILEKQPDGLVAGDAINKLAEHLPPTAEEQGRFPSGKPKFRGIVNYATVDLVKAGWLIKDSACRWHISQDGKQALKDYPEPIDLVKRAKQLYREWRKAQGAPVVPAGEEQQLQVNDAIILEHEVEANADSNKTFYEEVQERAWEDLAAYVGNMPPFEFQLLIGDLLKAMGYYILWGEENTGGADGGLDLVVNKDPLGMEYPRVKVQAKRQQKAVTLDNMKSFAQNLEDCDSGIYVCIAGFSGEAAKYARENERPISIFDLEKFLKLWYKFYDKLDEAAHRRLPIKPVYMLVPPSE